MHHRLIWGKEQSAPFLCFQPDQCLWPEAAAWELLHYCWIRDSDEPAQGNNIQQSQSFVFHTNHDTGYVVHTSLISASGLRPVHGSFCPAATQGIPMYLAADMIVTGAFQAIPPLSGRLHKTFTSNCRDAWVPLHCCCTRDCRVPVQDGTAQHN